MKWQKTAKDHLAHLVIRASCDVVMKLLVHKLDLQTAEYHQHKDAIINASV